MGCRQGAMGGAARCGGIQTGVEGPYHEEAWESAGCWLSETEGCARKCNAAGCGDGWVSVMWPLVISLLRGNCHYSKQIELGMK